MHTLGKVMIWLVALLAIAVVVLSGGFIQSRGKWIRDVKAARDANETNAKRIAEKRSELRHLKQEYAQKMLEWDRYWSDIPVNVPMNINPADPTFEVTIGSSSGIGFPETPEKPVLHLYMPVGNGVYQYVGPFQASSIQEARTAVKPTWRARPNEVASWKSGNWRVRTQVPAAYVDHFREYQNDLTVSDELMVAKQRNVQVQDSLIATAKEHLKDRQEELLGFANPPANANVLDPEWSKGLVAALDLEDQARNAELAEVDRLRREVKTEFRKEQRLSARNARLAGSLPGAQPATAEPPKEAVSSK